MIEYDLPEDWELMSQLERLDWHSDRVMKEEPVYTTLEETGVLTCFEADEIRVRLAVVQAERRMVEAALSLALDQEFQGLWETLQAMIDEVRENIATRAKILNLQFKRKTFKATVEETDKLAALRTSVDNQLDAAEEIEGEIIRVCDRHKVNPISFLLVDEVREAK